MYVNMNGVLAAQRPGAGPGQPAWRCSGLGPRGAAGRAGRG